MANNRKRLIHQRRQFTNERHCRALAELRASRGNSDLIPAANPTQADFEAELLERIGYGTSPQETPSGDQHPFGVLEVIPREGELELVLSNSRDAFTKFVSDVSPMLDRDQLGVSGFVGLRAAFRNGKTVLNRLNAPGKVIIRGVSEDDWMSALYESFEVRDYVDSAYLGSRATLHDAEKQDLADLPFPNQRTGDRVAIEILSGILRRKHIFRAQSQVKFIDLWFNFYSHGADINIEWAGDLSHASLISRLLDGNCGLPLKVANPDRCYCEPCTASTYQVTLRDRKIGKIKLNLRRSDLYDDELPLRRVGQCESVAVDDPAKTCWES